MHTSASIVSSRGCVDRIVQVIRMGGECCVAVLMHTSTSVGYRGDMTGLGRCVTGFFLSILF